MKFPDPTQTEEDGILCWGGDLEIASLLEAYSIGVFPWPHPGFPLLWFSPIERGVLDFSRLHVSRSLQKLRRQNRYRLSIDQDFAGVIERCQNVLRPGQNETWITDELKDAYIEMHRAGHAHSVECWDGGDLVGGLYGVYYKNVFSAESMFHFRDNASKLCLLHIVEYLASLGLTWMDIQMVTPILEHFGAHYISRAEFLERLSRAHQRGEVVFSPCATSPLGS